MSLSFSLLNDVTPAIRARGFDYYRSGVVKLDSVSTDSVTATVSGSGRYLVMLDLEDQVVHCSCTCPYIEENDAPCKHIWATVLAAEARGFAATAATSGSLRLVLDEDDEFDDDDDEYDEFPKRPHHPSPPPERAVTGQHAWKDLLAALRREVNPTSAPTRTASERQLVYVIDAPASQQVRKVSLEIHVQERKLNGEWGKPKAQHVPTHQLSTLSDSRDRQLLALLGGAERGDGYGFASGYSYGVPRYRLAGPVLDAVLPLLADLGRVRLRRNSQPPIVLDELVADLHPSWVLATSITRDTSGKRWVLTGRLCRGDETFPLSAPTLIVPGLIVWDGRFGRFDDTGAFAWVQTLRNAGVVTIPDGKADELLGQMMQLPGHPKLDLPEELKYVEEASQPKPRVVVKPSKQSFRRDPVLEIDLSFDYCGVIVPSLPVTRGVFQSDGRKFLLRDPDAEQAAERELARLGVRPGGYAGAPTNELKPTLLSKLVRELVAAGWSVEADGKLYRPASAFKLAVRSETDWFDLNGTADFGGSIVAFPRLLEAINRGESTVVLDDGSIGMVPEDWLKKFGLLTKMGTVEGDSVRYSRAQVGVLDALLASRPEVTFDKQFARARDELQKFQGVAAVDPPAKFKGELREYQREGLGWLRFLRKFGFGGCLADDMGLGKTVQVLALLAGKRNGPALVVVPRSLIFNWKQEAAKFTPKLKVLDHTGTGRDKTGASFKDFDIVLTTYGTLRKDAAIFAEVRFDTCVLDESQAAKNAETETAKAVRVIEADHRLALSGTPIENHLGELWTLFDFLNPGMLGRAALFAGGTGSMRNPDAESRELLAKALRPYILRRTKAQVAKDLPEKTEQTVYCDLEPAQRKLYDELRDHYRQSLLGRIDTHGLGQSKIQVLAALMRLRQAACHPGLIDEKFLAEPSAKLDVLLPQLAELAESGQKSLVFSQFTSLLDIVRKRLDAEGVKYEYLDGRTRDREIRVERFQTDPTCKLFLVSLKAGGVGLNLTAAEYVFLLDPWWNPAVEAQAIDRSHRIGQTKPVFAYRLIARGTVEEKVLALQASKRELADAILGGDSRLITDMKREDLELLLS